MALVTREAWSCSHDVDAFTSCQRCGRPCCARCAPPCKTSGVVFEPADDACVGHQLAVDWLAVAVNVLVCGGCAHALAATSEELHQLLSTLDNVLCSEHAAARRTAGGGRSGPACIKCSSARSVAQFRATAAAVAHLTELTSERSQTLKGSGVTRTHAGKAIAVALGALPVAALGAVGGTLGGIFTGAVAGGVGGAVLGGAAALDARNSTASAVSAGASAAGRMMAPARKPSEALVATSAAPATPAAASADAGDGSDAGRELARLLKSKSAYDTLGVAANASAEEIRTAYRSLSRRYHPDRNPAPAAKDISQLLNNAYALVGDEEKRRAYDRSGFKDTSGIDLLGGITVTRDGAAMSAIGSILGATVGAGVGMVGGAVMGLFVGAAGSVASTARYASFTLTAQDTLRDALSKRLQEAWHACVTHARSPDGLAAIRNVSATLINDATPIPELRIQFDYATLPAVAAGSTTSEAPAATAITAAAPRFQLPDIQTLTTQLSEAAARGADDAWTPDAHPDDADAAGPPAATSMSQVLERIIETYPPQERVWLRKAMQSVQSLLAVAQRLSGITAAASESNGEYRDPDFAAAASAVGLDGITEAEAPKSALGLLSLYSRQMSKGVKDVTAVTAAQSWAILATRYERWARNEPYDQAKAMQRFAESVGLAEPAPDAAATTASGSSTTNTSTSSSSTTTTTAPASAAAVAGSAKAAWPEDTVRQLRDCSPLLRSSAAPVTDDSAHARVEIAVVDAGQRATSGGAASAARPASTFPWRSGAAAAAAADAQVQSTATAARDAAISWQHVVSLPLRATGNAYTIPLAQLRDAYAAATAARSASGLPVLPPACVWVRVTDPVAAALAPVLSAYLPAADAERVPIRTVMQCDLPSQLVTALVHPGGVPGVSV